MASIDFNGIFGHKDQANDRHVITTNHPYMTDLGMNVFTTGTLQEWWDEMGFEDTSVVPGAYIKINRQLIGGGGWEIRDLLEGDGNHFFTAWDQKSRTWIKHEEVGTHLLSSWEWENEDGGNNYKALDLHPWLTGGTYQSFEHTSGPVLHSPDVDSDGGLNVTQTNLGNLIEMNNWYINYSTDNPDENTWPPAERAASQFVRGVKASLNNQGIMWSGEVPFKFSNCVKKDWVTFHLQLFDNKNPKKRTKRAALDLSQLNLVGSPIDSLGIEYRTGSKRDGEYEPAATSNNPAAMEGGGLDLTKNELTGKWESGTPQIMAIMETQVPAAFNLNGTYPSVGDLQSFENTDILTTSSNAYFNPGTGLAMPIVMQNANPLQWSPQYKEPASCRKDNKKTSLPVVNISKASFEPGDIVMLSRINGVWVPVSFGEPGSEPGIASVFEGKWQFTYLMTNYNYFFRNKHHVNSDGSTGSQVERGTYYERSFWIDYYTDAPDGDDVLADLGNRGDWGPKPGGYPVALVNGQKHGFYQTTSWDFMGKGIGGVRSDLVPSTTNPNVSYVSPGAPYATGHSIAGTQARFNTKMEPLEKANTHARHHAPFWGCVFPGGYNTGGKFEQYNDTNAGWEALGIDENNSNDGKFFSNTSNAAEAKTFFEPDNDVNNGEGSPVGMFGQESPRLEHLPADIATNASPFGVNGMPIVDQARIGKYLTLGSARYGDANSHVSSEKYFKGNERYAWMSISKDENGTDKDDTFTSAFDFAPTDPKIIQFRPLRAETYASFDINNTLHADLYYNTNLFTRMWRGAFAATAWDFVKDTGAPMSFNILERNEGLHGGIGVLPGGHSPPSPATALHHGFFDLGHLPGLFNNNMPYTYYNGPGYDSYGAAAFGIIGAVCTVQTAGDIVFNTDPCLGMNPWLLNVWGSSWSAGSLVTSPQTSMLYAKVFTAWPRDLTVYDPRYFAVHHFNPGVGIAHEDIDWQWYKKGVAKGFDNTGVRIEPDTTAVPADKIGYPNDWYKVWDVDTTEVDFTYPTIHLNNDTGKGGYADTGTSIWRDRVGGFLNHPDVHMREPAHWDFTSKHRRGKLLPYFYVRASIGIYHTDNQFPLNTKLLGQKMATDTGIVILEQGTGYTDKDRFTTNYGTGKDLLLKPIITAGKITGFELDGTEPIDRVHDPKAAAPTGQPARLSATFIGSPQYTKSGGGRDYSPGDFISYDKVLDADTGNFNNVTDKTTSSLRLVTVNKNGYVSTGEKLEAYIIRGEIVSSTHADEKPVLVEEEKRLTGVAPNSSKSFGGRTSDVKEMLTSPLDTRIATDGMSPDGRYDIFLFFQNEISHTMSYNKLAFGQNPQAYEQFVDLSISFA